MHDFATRYSIRFAELPAFRHLSPEEYQGMVAGLIREIEEECERKRDGNSVAGVEKILNQNPFEPPTRVTKRSPKPLFHFATQEQRDEFEDGFMAFLGQYRIALGGARHHPLGGHRTPGGSGCWATGGA